MDAQKMWKELETTSLVKLSQRYGLSCQKLVAIFDQAGLTGRRKADPSPEEIRERAAKERANWTPAVEEARWIAARRLLRSLA